MDPVDVLTVAVHAAQLIRSGTDPEHILVGAYKALELESPIDEDDPLAVRIARLVEAAGANRSRLIVFLSKQAGPLPLNRPAIGWGGAVEPGAVGNEEADPEAEKLANYAEVEANSASEMMGDFPAFSVAEKQVAGYFETEHEGLPTTVRGLIDYPLDRPCLFTINVGEAPWSIWDICCAFANQYARIYEQPEKYGVWGHDLTDLWIERLLYFPEKGLIYPHVGS